MPERPAPAAPVQDSNLFPPEPEARAPQPPARAPLRVRRSARAGGGVRPRKPGRGATPFDEASAAAGAVGPRAARPALRVLAAGSDLVLLGCLDAAAVWLTLRLTGLDMQSFGVLPLPPLVAFLCLLDGGYVVGLTAAGGQTFGKMACGLRVADAAGGPVTVPQAVMRTLWTPVSLTLGVLWTLFDQEGRALHDALAGTRVLAVSPVRPAPRPEGGAA